MRFVTDVGVSRSTTEALRQQGHDVLHLREVGLHRLPDDEILALARREDRIILTFDLDFGDLLAAGGHSLPSVILLRLRDQTPTSATPRVMELVALRETELRAGAIIIIEDKRYRLRHLPISGFEPT